jgi:hypothetical protein
MSHFFISYCTLLFSAEVAEFHFLFEKRDQENCKRLFLSLKNAKLFSYFYFLTQPVPHHAKIAKHISYVS